MYIDINMSPKEGSSYAALHFDSIQDFVRMKDTKESQECWHEVVEDKMRQQSKKDNLEWFGVESMQELQESLSIGNDRYVKLVDDSMVSFKSPTVLRRRRAYGNSGDELDVHRMNSGNFSSMWTYRSARPSTGIKNIRLVVNNCQSWNVESNDMKWIGVTAVVLSVALQNAGYNVNITGCSLSEDVFENMMGKPDHHYQFYPIKDYSTNFDIKAICGATVSPAMFRTAGFMNKGVHGWPLDDGLGVSFKGRELVEDCVGKIYNDSSELFFVIHNDILSKEKCKNEIDRILQEIETGEVEKKEKSEEWDLL